MTIKIYPFTKLGKSEHGWLKARHHFSFGNYYDSNRLGFASLRVINDDIIQPSTGFDTHPHKNMEIITYVKKGAITHRDNKGNIGKTTAGDVQVMSAGSGIAHSEYNLENEETHLYQIWIKPNILNTVPSWDSHKFPKETAKNNFTLLVSGNQDAPLHIKQTASIYAGYLEEEKTISHKLDGRAYLLIADGEINLNDKILQKGDGAEIENEQILEFKALIDSEIILITF